MAAPLPPPRPCSARPAPDPIETEKIKEELQIANQRLQQVLFAKSFSHSNSSLTDLQLQEINAKLEHELEEEKNRGKQLSQAVGAAHNFAMQSLVFCVSETIFSSSITARVFRT